ncbi:MAG: C39 family peptidase [Oligoflexia bacterium]|nr:C39 family peptidase [Oligoflexia bacterium]
MSFLELLFLSRKARAALFQLPLKIAHNASGGTFKVNRLLPYFSLQSLQLPSFSQTLEWSSLKTMPYPQSKTILNCKSYQQTTDYTCGPAAIVTLLNFYKRHGDAMKIASEMGSRDKSKRYPGTIPDEMGSWLSMNGFSVKINSGRGTEESLRDIKNEIQSGRTVLVEWIDWGGHWALATGYEEGKCPKGTLDTLYLADPCSCFYGKKKGIIKINTERFTSMWCDLFYLGEFTRNVYIVAIPNDPVVKKDKL